jgi:hypothetical protein
VLAEHANKALLLRRAVCVSRLRGQPPSKREAFRGTFSTSKYPKIDFCERAIRTFATHPDKYKKQKSESLPESALLSSI